MNAHSLVRDVWRSLNASKSAALLAVLSMAIGIAATAVTLSIVDATLLRPLPYPEPEQIVELTQPSSLGGEWPFTYRFFHDAQGRLPGIQSLAALSFSDLILETGHEPLVVSAVACSASLADVLQVDPLWGQFFSAAQEVRVSGGSVALISQELWRQRFGSDPGILGRSLRLDGRSFAVIGIMPSGLRVPPLDAPPEVWIPLGADPMLDQLEKMFPDTWDRSAYLSLWARLGAGFKISAIEQPIQAAGLPLLAQADPDFSEDAGFRVASVEEQIRREYQLEIYVLVLATLLTLAVSCANVTSLMLAREPARRLGVSIRSALGGTPLRIAGGAILEGVVISSLGAAAGVAATWPVFQILQSYLPEGMLPSREFSLNAEVLALVVLVSLLSAVGVSLLPAIRLARLGVAGLGGGAARSSSEGRPAKGSRKALIASEVTCAVVALALAVVLFRTYWGVTAIPLGFEPRPVLVADLKLPQNQISGDRWKQLAKTLTAAIRPQSGVASASVALSAPAGRTLRISFRITDQMPEGPAGIADYQPVCPGYFKVLAIPVLKGRPFLESDSSQTARVCLVNQTLAREHFPQGREIGARITPLGTGACEIVGVVGDVTPRNLRDRPAQTIYVPFDQMPSEAIQGFMSILVRVSDGSRGGRGYVIGSLTEAVRQNAPALPVAVRTLSAVVDELSALERFRALLIGSVSFVSLALASVGVYGITANYVSYRRREAAIRLALGTTAGQIILDFVKDALRLTAIGLVAGFAIAYPLVHLLGKIVFGAQSLTGLEVVAVVLAMACVASLSAYIPGRRLVGLNAAEVLKDV